MQEKILAGEVDPRELFDRILGLMMKSQVQSLLSTYFGGLDVKAQISQEILSTNHRRGRRPKYPHLFPDSHRDMEDGFQDLRATVEELVKVIGESVIRYPLPRELEKDDPRLSAYSGEDARPLPTHREDAIDTSDVTHYFAEKLDRNSRDEINNLLKRAVKYGLVEYLEEAGYAISLSRKTWGDVLDDKAIQNHIKTTTSYLARQFLMHAILYTFQLREDQAPLIESIIMGKIAAPGEVLENIKSGKLRVFPEMQITLDDTREARAEKVNEHIAGLNRWDEKFRGQYADRIRKIGLPDTRYMIMDWQLPCVLDENIFQIFESRYQQERFLEPGNHGREDVLLWLEEHLQLEGKDWKRFVDECVRPARPDLHQYIRDSLEYSRHIHFLADHLTRLLTQRSGDSTLAANMITRIDIAAVWNDEDGINPELQNSLRKAVKRGESGKTRRGIFTAEDAVFADAVGWDAKDFRPWLRSKTLEIQPAGAEMTYDTVMEGLLGIVSMFTDVEGKLDLYRDVTVQDILQSTKGRISPQVWQHIWEDFLLPELENAIPHAERIQESGAEFSESFSRWAAGNAQKLPDRLRELYERERKAQADLRSLETDLRGVNKELARLNVTITTTDVPPPQLDEDEGLYPWEEPQFRVQRNALSAEQRMALQQKEIIHKKIRIAEEELRAIRYSRKIAQERAAYFTKLSKQFSPKNVATFESLPLIALLHLAQGAASRIFEEYREEGGTAVTGNRVNLIEFKVPSPYKQNIDDSIRRAVRKEFCRLVMTSRLAFGTTRHIGQKLSDWVRGIIGMNTLLGGQIGQLSSTIINLPTWMPDYIPDLEHADESIRLYRDTIQAGHPFGYHHTLGEIKGELLDAIEQWFIEQEDEKVFDLDDDGFEE